MPTPVPASRISREGEDATEPNPTGMCASPSGAPFLGATRKYSRDGALPLCVQPDLHVAGAVVLHLGAAAESIGCNDG
jgi:hypothetical protein